MKNTTQPSELIKAVEKQKDIVENIINNYDTIFLTTTFHLPTVSESVQMAPTTSSPRLPKATKSCIPLIKRGPVNLEVSKTDAEPTQKLVSLTSCLPTSPVPSTSTTLCGPTLAEKSPYRPFPKRSFPTSNLTTSDKPSMPVAHSAPTVLFTKTSLPELPPWHYPSYKWKTPTRSFTPGIYTQSFSTIISYDVATLVSSES